MTTFRFLGQQFERVRSWRFRRKGSRGERYDSTTAGGGVALDAAVDELVGRSSDHGGIRCVPFWLNGQVTVVTVGSFLRISYLRTVTCIGGLGRLGVMGHSGKNCANLLAAGQRRRQQQSSREQQQSSIAAAAEELGIERPHLQVSGARPT